MREGIFAALTALMVAMTLLPLWKNPIWWVRALDFPRLQLCTLAVGLLIAQALVLPYNDLAQCVITVLSLLCLAYHAWWIIPYTPLWRTEVRSARETDEAPRLSVMAANVLTPNRNAEGLKALIREHRPDVLVTLETDHWWETQLEAITDAYPHSIRCPLDNLYGMHVYSRLPLENAETCYLVEKDVPSMHAMVVINDRLKVRMHFLHPAPPSPTENAASTERDVELLVVAKSVQDDGDVPIIVAGDLNDVAWSANTRLFRKTSKLLDPRVGRGMVNSFHARYWFLRWPLDHFFHSHHFRLARIQRLPYFGSDHFPVLVELQYAPAPDQESLQGDAADEREARETIRRKNVEPSDVPEPDK